MFWNSTPFVTLNVPPVAALIFKTAHPRNIGLVSIDVKLAGMVRVLSEEQEVNALAHMVFNPSFRTTWVSAAQLAKARVSIVVILFGSVTLVSPVHS